MSTRPIPPAKPPSKFKDGFRAIARSIWFVLSLMLYAFGVTLRLAGSALVRLSGWEQRNTTTTRPPSPPPN